MKLAYSWWRVPALNRLRLRVQQMLGLYPARIVPGPEVGEDVEISGLVCPLRYDLDVRVEFFRFVNDEMDRFERDAEGFLAAPPVRAYSVWFREIVVPKYLPQIMGDDAALRDAFRRRVDDSVALWRSIQRRGLAPGNPIRLFTGEVIHSANGKAIRGRLYAGDGCHRLACLRVSGHTVLRPDQYDVAVMKEYTPPDNTRILREKLPLSTEDYCRFLSRHYFGGRDIATPEGLMQEMAGHDRHEMEELRSVLLADFPECRSTA